MKEKTLMEIGGLKLVEADYSSSVYVCGELNKDLSLELVVPMPAPYSDENLDFDINEEDAKQLIEHLQNHFWPDGRAGDE